MNPEELEQQSEKQAEQDILKDILLGTGQFTGVSAVAGGGILAERARRNAKANGYSYSDALKRTGADVIDDIQASSKVLQGKTPYDETEKYIRKNPSESVYSPGSMRAYASQQPEGDFYSTKSKKPGEYIRNPLAQMAIAARDAFNPSAEDFLGFRREDRLSRGESPEGPKSDTVFSRIPSLDGARDLLPEGLGGFNSAERAAREKAGINLMKGNSLQATGGMLGRIASDAVNNGARSVWWLLNAPQAAVDGAAEGLAGMFNRDGLYGLDYALENEALRRGWVKADVEGTRPSPASSHVNSVRYDGEKLSANDPQINRHVKKLKEQGQKGERLYSRRRVGNNLSTLLALPGAYAINAGMGLTNLDGGAEGRKAVFPSEEDPTKTTSMVSEIAAKYILGRQGDLLPWDEYKRVRPDVSKDEYMAYKAYKFNKTGDYNVFDDGRLNMGNGILKYNSDGIDGSEVMFLGRSLPTNTTLLPTALGIGGTALGVAFANHGGMNINGVEEGIERRKTERTTLKNQMGAYVTQPSDDPQMKLKQKRLTTLDKEIGNRTKRLDWMNSGPQSRLFTNPRVKGAGVIGAGLTAGIAAMTGGTLVGNEIERRRREGNLKQNAS